MSSEFYIGYLPSKGPVLARFTRSRLRAALLIALAVGGLLMASMSPFSSAVFEFGVERDFEGVLVEGAVPILSVERPGESALAPSTSSYMLVAFGKHGAESQVAQLTGHNVRLRGSLIYRDEQTMIELIEGSIEDLGEAPTPLSNPMEEELGEQALTGEIVDSKCFLGVMKPGNLKPHRACAVRCISGGVPPVLLVRDEAGFASYYLLVSETGEAVNAEVLDRIAEPLRIEGRVVRRAGMSFLYADPKNYQPVSQ